MTSCSALYDRYYNVNRFTLIRLYRARAKGNSTLRAPVQKIPRPTQFTRIACEYIEDWSLRTRLLDRISIRNLY